VFIETALICKVHQIFIESFTACFAFGNKGVKLLRVSGFLSGMKSLEFA
jgi:hypothetical protein